MDFAYYSYLVRTVPKLDLARSFALKAMHAVVSRVSAAVPDAPLNLPGRARARQQRRLAGRPGNARHPLLLPEAREATAKVLRERFPESCAAVLAEAEAAREGTLAVFGRPVDCSLDARGLGEPTAPLCFDRDPNTLARYQREVRGPLVNVFVPGADAKAAWEVGRLTHLWRYGQARWLATTAEERTAWARAWLNTLRQFRSACPYGFGVQWSVAMEVSARAMHIGLTFGLVCDDPIFDAATRAEVLSMLQEHGVFIEQNLEDSSAVRTNHYAADLVGLVVIGALFPELPGAARWRTATARLLWEQILKQCRTDGTHFESSTGYQRLIGELFLAAVVSAKAGAIPAPAEVERAVVGLCRSLGELTKPSGRIPQIGDFDSCRGLPLHPRAALDAGYFPALGAAALCEPTLKFEGDACPPEAAWLCGAAGVSLFDALPAKGVRRSRVLGEAGIAVLREGEAYVAMSAGPNGQGGCGGHAHNDKNSVELEWRGHDVIVDRGTFVYARDPEERNARRGTAAHSTVQVDSAEQSRIHPNRLFALPDLARARIADLWQRDGVEVTHGEHHGYERLPGGVTHRRSAALWRMARAVAFVDTLAGKGDHVLDLRFHVPHTNVTIRPATPDEAARLRLLSADKIVPLPLATDRCVEVSAEKADGTLEPIALFAFSASLPYGLSVEEEDVSPGYGELKPARCVHLSAAGPTPATICTGVLLLG